MPDLANADRVGPIDVAGAHIAPDIVQRFDRPTEIIGMAGQRRGIDRTGRGAAENGDEGSGNFRSIRNTPT